MVKMKLAFYITCAKRQKHAVKMLCSNYMESNQLNMEEEEYCHVKVKLSESEY